MNTIRLVIPGFRNACISAFIVMLAMILASSAHAADKGCWADFFEHSEYDGKHVLLQGPTQLENLNKIDGEDWNLRIHSLKVGPKAKVTLYQNPKFKLDLPVAAKDPELMRAWGITEQDIKEDSELIFNENANIHDLGGL